MFSKRNFVRVVSCLWLCLATTLCFAEPKRFVLASVEENTRLESFELSKFVSSELAAKWTIRQVTLHGGKQEGVQLITIDNGRIIVTVVPTRGMSILSVRDSQTGDRLFGWDSPVEEMVHPSLIDLESRGGLGWLEGFNEWMVRCGLEFAGHPGTDQFINNTGDVATMDVTLHGKIGNIPASEVELRIDQSAPFGVTLRGVVEERSFYGPKLRLTTELTLVPDSKSLQLNDSITNLGAANQEFQVIYHTNFGTPLLEEGAKVMVAAAKISPMNEIAAKAIATYDTYGAPQPGFVEQVYLVQPHSDQQGRTAAVLVNASKTRGAMVAWSTQSLPYLTLWKNTAAKADGYVTGIEPGTGYPFNRRVERHYGRVPKLEPGETELFSLEFIFLDGPGEVANGIGEIAKLATDRELIVTAQPPENPFAE